MNLSDAEGSYNLKIQISSPVGLAAIGNPSRVTSVFLSHKDLGTMKVNCSMKKEEVLSSIQRVCDEYSSNDDDNFIKTLSGSGRKNLSFLQDFGWFLQRGDLLPQISNSDEDKNPEDQGDSSSKSSTSVTQE